MSELPNHPTATPEKVVQGVTPPPAVTATPPAKPLESTSLPPAQSMVLSPGTIEHPIRHYQGDQHSAEPPRHPVGAHFPANAASARQQPYRVVTTHVIYHDSDEAPPGIAGTSGHPYPRPVRTDHSAPRGVAPGPSYSAQPPPMPHTPNLPGGSYPAQVPYSAPVGGIYSGGPGAAYYGDPRAGQTNFERGAPIPPGQYTYREHEILGNVQRECISRLFAEPPYKRWKTPEDFMPAPPPQHYQAQSQRPHRYQSHSQQTYPGPAPHLQANFDNYNAPHGYPQSKRRICNGQRGRTSEDDRMTASELARKQAERPEGPEPTKEPALRRLFGSRRRNERREKDEEARRNNYYY